VDSLIHRLGDLKAAAVLARAVCKGFEPATDADYAAVRRGYRQIDP
jgi:hypothetical protein